MVIEESLAFPARPEAIWPWISTPERLGRWIADVERFEAVPPGEPVEGSQLIAHLPRGGAPIEALVEQAERPRALVLRASRLPNDLEALLEFRVREEEGGSVLTIRAETALKGLMVFAEKLIASKARARLASWTEALRAQVGS